jgi:hypothetical protein
MDDIRVREFLTQHIMSSTFFFLPFIKLLLFISQWYWTQSQLLNSAIKMAPVTMSRQCFFEVDQKDGPILASGIELRDRRREGITWEVEVMTKNTNK